MEEEAERLRLADGGRSCRPISDEVEVDATPRKRPAVPRRVERMRAAREEDRHVPVVPELGAEMLGR